MLGSLTNHVFLGGAQRKLARIAALILTYHHVGPPPRGARDPFLHLTPEALDEQLDALRRAGLQPAPLADFAQPGRFIVTFDDGFRSALELAAPVLARHGVKAVQFVVAGRIGGQNDWDVAKGDVAAPLMNAGEIKQWLAAGHEIGSHSLTHLNLKKLSAAAAREEIMTSRKKLEDEFGVAVRHFCYPFGGMNAETPGLVRTAGYATACTVETGVNPPGADPFQLRRLIPLSSGELVRKALHRLKR